MVDSDSDSKTTPGADWKLEDLQNHLQYAVDLEFWTIPYYLTALYSVQDQSGEIYQLIRAVVAEEMLHLELAANIANTYGMKVKFAAPKYGDDTIPHLNFSLSKQDPRKIFTNWTTELGSLDASRIDTMCIIEFPDWGDDLPATVSVPEVGDAKKFAQEEYNAAQGEFLSQFSPVAAEAKLRKRIDEYSSMGAFYNAVKIGAWKFYDKINPQNQVNDFQRYYANAKRLTITESASRDNGLKGVLQVWELLHLITDQGEGENEATGNVSPEYRNTATDPRPVLDHYGKFLTVRAAGNLPDTYQAESTPKDEAAQEAQDTLVENFTKLREVLERRFAGEDSADFWPLMATVGANVRTCWQRGAIPQFS
jgi:hypothetical protein